MKNPFQLILWVSITLIAKPEYNITVKENCEQKENMHMDAKSIKRMLANRKKWYIKNIIQRKEMVLFEKFKAGLAFEKLV